MASSAKPMASRVDLRFIFYSVAFPDPAFPRLAGQVLVAWIHSHLQGVGHSGTVNTLRYQHASS